MSRNEEIEVTTRAFALILGIAFLAIGALGFIPVFVTPAAAHADYVRFTFDHGYLFGVLPVNYFVNLAHLAMGAWGIAASRGAGAARAYAKTIAVISGALAILGVVPMPSAVFALLPIYGKAVWLHAIAAVCAGFFGWIMPRRSIFADENVAVR